MKKTNTQLINEIEENVELLAIGLTHSQDKRLRYISKMLRKKLRNDYRLLKKKLKEERTDIYEQKIN